MTTQLTDMDAHEQPPPELRACWKRHSKCPDKDLAGQKELDDLSDPKVFAQFEVARHIRTPDIQRAYLSLDETLPKTLLNAIEDKAVYFHPSIPGLFY